MAVKATKKKASKKVASKKAVAKKVSSKKVGTKKAAKKASKKKAVKRVQVSTVKKKNGVLTASARVKKVSTTAKAKATPRVEMDAPSDNGPHAA